MLSKLPEAHYEEAIANENTKDKVNVSVLSDSLSRAIAAKPPKADIEKVADELLAKASPAAARIVFGGCSH